MINNEEQAMKRRYKLLTAKDKKALPGLYGGGDDPIVHVKWFSPWSGWDWYVTSFDGDDTCFGLAHRFGGLHGHESEWTCFSLSQIDALRTEFGGLMAERDRFFKPKRISEIWDRIMTKEPSASGMKISGSDFCQLGRLVG